MREQERDTLHKRALRSQAGSAGPSLVTADGLGGLGRFGILPDEFMQEILRIRKTEDAALTIQRMWRGFTARVMPLTAYLDCLQLWNDDPMYEE